MDCILSGVWTEGLPGIRWVKNKQKAGWLDEVNFKIVTTIKPTMDFKAEVSKGLLYKKNSLGIFTRGRSYFKAVRILRGGGDDLWFFKKIGKNQNNDHLLNDLLGASSTLT